MTDSSRSAEIWQVLQTHRERLLGLDLSELLSKENRFANNHQTVSNLLVDWTRQLVDEPIHTQLNQLAAESRVYEFLLGMNRGDLVNWTESRSAAHVSHRSSIDDDESIQYMLRLAEDIRYGRHSGHSGKPFTDIVNVGIGGSYLGPAMVYQALDPMKGPRVRFLTNIHHSERRRLLDSLNPDTTLIIVASKSYGTFETLENARYMRQWMLERVPPDADIGDHFIHITSNPDRVKCAGPVLRVPVSIGGRFSLWSAMGLAIAIAIGSEGFKNLIAGARAIDEHVLETKDLERNLGIKLALLSLWNTNILNTESHLILSYDPRLRLLPAYLQQLEMESNGKSITSDGTVTDHQTSPIVWGGIETDGQHAYHQLLHQGTRKYSADFVVTRSLKPTKDIAKVEDWTIANAVAQSTVMFAGFQAPSGKNHMNIPGKQGSTIVVLNELNAFNLGALIALYEHKTACLGHLWNINSFDQWGVEAGKKMADDVYKHLQQETVPRLHACTVNLLAKIKRS